MASDFMNSLTFDSWSSGLGARQSPFCKVVGKEAEDIVGIRHQAKASENIEFCVVL
jgi:hypothetical protein